MAKPIEAAVGRQNAVLDQQYQLDLENYNNLVIQEDTLRKAENQRRTDEYEHNLKIQEAQEKAQIDAYERSDEVYQNNLKSIDFYADTARSRVQLGLDEQIANMSFQLEDLERDFSKRAAAAAFADTQQQEVINNAVENAGLQQKELAIQKAQQTAEFDAKLENIRQQEYQIGKEYDIEQRGLERFNIRERGLERFDIEKKKASTETRYQQLNNQLETIIKTGAAQARGVKGRGANKVINSIAAMSGVNTQRFNDSLYLAEQSITLEKDLAKQSIDLERDQAGRTSELKKFLGLKRTETERTLTKQQKLSILGDKTAEKGSAAYLGSLGIQEKQITARKEQTKTAAETKQDEIAQMLGIDVEEIESSKEKLAESIMSAGAAAKNQLEDITNKAFEAKNQSYAQRMLKPRFGPKLPEPFKVPKTEYVKPLPPIPVNKGSIKGGAIGGSRPQQPSTLSTALSIGGAVASIAAPFTGVAAPFIGGIGQAANFFADLFK